MSRVYAFLADGFEEVECLAVVDLLRRANVETSLVSITGKLEVTGAHHINVKADKLFEEIDYKEAEVLFLPGGMPGTKTLSEHKGLKEALLYFHENNKRLAAICAAPSVLGQLGILNGKRATSFPGFEEMLLGAEVVEDSIVVDGNILTGKGMGIVIEFGLELIKLLVDEKTALDIKKSIQYNRS
ncbi:MAG: DJ-1/PfpI family protein [Clostridiales bacterium]|nr:DJ-1/PfpI family protein [Clostridiales bacterium]